MIIHYHPHPATEEEVREVAHCYYEHGKLVNEAGLDGGSPMSDWLFAEYLLKEKGYSVEEAKERIAMGTQAVIKLIQDGW